MAIHDFECRACGNVERDLYYHHDNLPRKKRCPKCRKKESRQIFDQWGTGQIDLDNPALYGRYHPQMGEVIRDYNHQKALMRKYGMYEASDPDRGNRHYSEEAMNEDGQPEPDDSVVQWGDREDLEKVQRDMQHSQTPIGVK